MGINAGLALPFEPTMELGLKRSAGGRAAKESTTVDLMAVQTCAALRQFDARSEAASSKIRLFGRNCRDAGAFGASEREIDDLLLVRLPAPPEGRCAPFQVMDGNCQRLSLFVVECYGRPAMT